MENIVAYYENVAQNNKKIDGDEKKNVLAILSFYIKIPSFS